MSIPCKPNPVHYSVKTGNSTAQIILFSYDVTTQIHDESQFRLILFVLQHSMKANYNVLQQTRANKTQF